MTIRRKVLHIFAVFVLLIATIFGMHSGKVITYATTTDYSGVLDDLRRDERFDVDDYPAVNGDKSLQVIQIAESTDDELFVYVYQPAAHVLLLTATSINISTEIGKDLSYRNYKLKHIDSTGVFAKYLVEGLKVNTNPVRYYAISNILRPFVEGEDADSTNGSISGVPNRVAQVWTAITYDGETRYSMTYSEVIEIENKLVGFVNYDANTDLGWDITAYALSAHFVAFSTDKPMDKLLSASLRFKEQDYTYSFCGNPLHVVGHKYKDKFNYNYSKEVVHPTLELKYSDKASSSTYKWNRIQTTQEFLQTKSEQDIEITKSIQTDLEETQWVLNFYETPMYAESDGVWFPLVFTPAMFFTGDAEVKATKISDVMILELEYEYDGETYKLGAVDSQASGGNASGKKPSDSDSSNWFDKLCKKLEKKTGVPALVWEIIFIAVPIIVVLIVLAIIFPVIRPVFKYFFIGLWYVITSPVRLIVWIVQQAKGKKNGKTSSKPKRRKK